jgi:hypothetical protein
MRLTAIAAFVAGVHIGSASLRNSRQMDCRQKAQS